MIRSVVNIGLLLTIGTICGQGIGFAVAHSTAQKLQVAKPSGVTWHYSEAGHWKNDFPACGGKQQSPVNFNRFAVQSGTINPIQFHNYDVLPALQTVTNDGHTVKVDIISTPKIPYIEWNVYMIMKVKYNFAQYHFHWGSASSGGSEHTVDTVRYPMELHLVHFNDKYADLATAVTNPDGLAVLGIFFVISRNDNPALAPIVAAIEKVNNYGTDPEHFEAANMYALASLLPSNTKRFFRYDGSLTTPPCVESVLWTVFEEPISISEAQMGVFRSVEGLVGLSSNNYRPTQSLNARKVQKTWRD